MTELKVMCDLPRVVKFMLKVTVTEVGIMLNPPRYVIGVLWSVGVCSMCRGSPGCKGYAGLCHVEEQSD